MKVVQRINLITQACRVLQVCLILCGTGLLGAQNSIALQQQPSNERRLQGLRNAVRLNPQSASARNALGLALGQRGQLDSAIAEFQEAIRLKPDFARR